MVLARLVYMGWGYFAAYIWYFYVVNWVYL